MTTPPPINIVSTIKNVTLKKNFLIVRSYLRIEFGLEWPSYPKLLTTYELISLRECSSLEMLNNLFLQ
jgi:hypothetical protein